MIDPRTAALIEQRLLGPELAAKSDEFLRFVARALSARWADAVEHEYFDAYLA